MDGNVSDKWEITRPSCSHHEFEQREDLRVSCGTEDISLFPSPFGERDLTEAFLKEKGA